MNIKWYILRYKNNHDIKQLGENLISLTILQVCGYVFPLITFPYLTRVIGADYFGILAFSTTVVSYLQTVTDWGFQFTAVRDIAQNREDKVAVSRIFSNVMNCRMFLLILCLVVLAILTIIVPSFNERALILFLTFLILPGHVIFPEWFFQGVEQMKYITIMNFLFKLVFTLLIFVFIKERSDYILQPVLTALGFLVAGLSSLYLIVKKWGYSWHWTSFREIAYTLKQGCDIFINTILPQIYNSFSQILLMIWSGPGACGIYGAADKFNSIMTQLIQVLSRAFFPLLARRIDKHRIYAILYMTINTIGALVLFFLSPFLIQHLLSYEFEESIHILRLLAVSLVFTALQNVYGTNYLIVLHYDRVIRNINIIASIFGFIISFPLVYYYGILGVAITVVTTRLILGLSVCYKAYKIKIQHL